jgi:hypothetical protein
MKLKAVIDEYDSTDIAVENIPKRRPLRFSSKVIRLEQFMIENDLKFNQSDISYAARKMKIPIHRAMLHFQELKSLLYEDSTENNRKIIRKIRKIKQRIDRISEKVIFNSHKN